MTDNPSANEPYLISPNFRAVIERRIMRLEQDAAHDESWIEYLEDPDHIRRHKRLAAIQRAEALRLRLFLDRTETRPIRTPDSPLLF